MVDYEEDILVVVEQELLQACPRTTNRKDAAGVFNSKEYDFVILNITGIRGFDLLEWSASCLSLIGRKSRFALPGLAIVI